MSRPLTTSALVQSEWRFILAMRQLNFGRFEFLRIQGRELVLDLWPTTVRGVKFGSEDPATSRTPLDEFELKRQLVELFEYVRAVDAGEIRCLEVRHGLPFSMEVEHRHDVSGGQRG